MGKDNQRQTFCRVGYGCRFCKAPTACSFVWQRSRRPFHESVGLIYYHKKLFDLQNRSLR